MTVKQASRPRFCIDALVDEYLLVIESGGDLRMIKSLKILRAIVVNAAFTAIALYTLWLGADPTLIGTLAFIALGGYNGVEILDYKALAQAIVEADTSSDQRDDGRER